MALTLSDYQHQTPKMLNKAVIRALREASPLMNTIPIVTVGTATVESVRIKTMPTASWRKIGQGHGTSKGGYEKVKDTAYSIGTYIDVDIALARDSNKLFDPRVEWSKQAVEAIAFAFNDSFVNGNPTIDPDGLTGLHYRLQEDLSDTQQILAAPNGLDISPDATGLAANIQTFFDKLDELIYSMPDHKADVLLCNDTMLMRYWSIARQSGLLKTTTDNLGREFNEYKGAKIFDIGYKVNSDTARIIGNTESISDPAVLTGGIATSVYALRLGSEYLTGFQMYPLETKDKGELEDGVTMRTVIDWVVGIAVTHPKSIARLYGIIAA